MHCNAEMRKIMKKLASLLLSLVLISSVFTVAPPQSHVAALDPSEDLTKDVNGDLVVDLRDVTALSRYFAGWPGIVVVEENLDINSDEEHNLKDVTFLSRFLAGWDLAPDYTVNNPSYNWPKITALDAAAGTPYSTPDQVPSSSGMLKKFLLSTDNNPTLPFNVACRISSNTVTAIIPAGVPLNTMKVDFLVDPDTAVLQGSTPVYSNLTEFDFTKPVTLTLVAKDNSRTDITVYVMTLNTGIPSMSISTNQLAAINSKTEYSTCSVFAGGGNRVSCPYANREIVSGTGLVKGRGWTSWYYYPKKSYTLKFDNKQQLFDLPAHKEWVLAANFADRSLLRNAVAMQMGTNVGLDFIMDVRFVDLWVNGKYEGSYQLLEKIEVSPNRVAITDFDPALEPDQVGFIIETNGHNKASEYGVYTNGQDADRPLSWTHPYGPTSTYDPYSGDIFFNSKHYSSIFVINKPTDTKLMGTGVNGQKYYDYVYNYMDKLEAAIKSRNYTEASKYLDMTSMAKWYIVQEATMNTDSKLHCSVFMYKDAGGKLKMGPLWDFDLGFGNGLHANTSTNPSNPHNGNSAYLDNATWFKDLLAMPQFKSLVKSVWSSSKASLNTTVTTYIDTTSALLQGSQELNFKKWSITQNAQWAYPYALSLSTYSAQVSYVKSFMAQRMTYMNNKISNW